MCDNKKELATKYDPKEVEDRIYDFWMKGKYFHPEVDPKKPPYTIVIPPPNITGQLHMGHALDDTLQDILIRYKRMKGYSALWLPGTDHASIATEAKIMAEMRQEGITKDDLGRDGFLKRAWEWKEKYENRIISQLQKLGTSCDWDRKRFTLDEGCNKAVNEVFKRLYDKGLIYRGERMINWCPVCETSISDAEVEFEEQDGAFYHLRYPLKDGSAFLNLATTRPETLLGDTAVAVHPDDERYKHLVGKTLILPLVGREIPVVADSYVEPDFGTGVVKITPAHDPNDFQVGARHDLEIINVMTDNAVINEKGGKYCGMDRFTARKAIVADLKEEGFLVKVEPHKHNVGTCYRCHTTVEPRISKQWFVDMEPLAKPAIDSVRNGDIKLVPQRFDKTYYNWMENIKDWCISRQLWWGHRIPAWYCADCGEITVDTKTPCKCSKCGSTNIKQDEDTLDTWFSSALWPFSTLGWPEKTPELEYFYPTNTLVTGYDIIFFWVARMIFSALEQTEQVPFDTVFFHGIVRDEQGRKMSKSLGNGVDPLIVIDEYGADALRFNLATGNSPGNDMRYIPAKVESCRNFANKIWNAARFILMNIEGKDVKNELPKELTTADKWIIDSFNTLSKEISTNLDNFEIGVAAQKVYDFIWDEFCDWYIEIAKIYMMGDNQEVANNTRSVLVYIFSSTLKLLHPFMPFITEEIWQSLPHEGEALIVAEYPEYNENLVFTKESDDIHAIMDLIRAIRNIRNEMNVPQSKKASVYIETAKLDLFGDGKDYITRLAYANNVEIGESFNIEGAVTVVTTVAKAYIPMDELVDKKAEKARLTKELEGFEKKLAQNMGKLNNAGFLAKAPEAVVAGVKAEVDTFNERIAMIKASLENL